MNYGNNTILNVVCFSQMAAIKVYYHFLFGLVVPLLIYDINTHSQYKYRIVNTLENYCKNILLLLFPNRVFFDNLLTNNVLNKYVQLLNDPTKSGIHENWNAYIYMLKLQYANKLPSDVLVLVGYDIFTDKTMTYYDKSYLNKLDNNKYNTIANKYVTNNKSLSPYEKNYRKQIYYTVLYTIFNEGINKINLRLNVPMNETYNNKILYIKRRANATATAQRFIINDDEIEQTIRSEFGDENVVCFYCEDNDFLTQHSAFKYARVIVGQHGSAFSNMYACMNQATGIVEISGILNLTGNSFKHIASILNIKYMNVWQNMLTEKEALKYFSNDNNALQELKELYHGKKYSIEERIMRPLCIVDNWPTCVLTAQNSGYVNPTDVVTAIKSILSTL